MQHSEQKLAPARSWKQKIRKWLKPPRRIRATTMGKFVLVFTVILGVAAVNTGNNLLYLILGSIFGLISASGILSERSMRAMTVQADLQGVALAEQPASIRVSVENAKSRGTAYLIEAKLEHIPSALFLSIAPETQKSLIVQATFDHRGMYDWDKAIIETRYPFDFYRRSYDLAASISVAVGPTPVIHGPAPLASGHANTRDSVTEYDRVRPYVAGDPTNRFHWKQTAARGQWMVREGDHGGSESLALSTADCRSEPDLENLCGWLMDGLHNRQSVTIHHDSMIYSVEPNGEGLREAIGMLAQFTIDTGPRQAHIA